MEKILTVPAAMPGDAAPVFATGNHHVSLGEITAGGSIRALGHFSRAGNCLVEHRGAPLFRLLLDGAPLEADSAAYTDDFIPTFRSATTEWKIFAPEGVRGFVVRAASARAATLTLECTPGGLLRSLFHSHPLEAARRFTQDAWTGCAVLEAANGFGVSALALGGSPGFSVEAGDGRLAVSLRTGGEQTVEFYVGVGAEQDGACLACMDMRRRAGALYEGYTTLLRARHVRLPHPVLEARANLNLNFCYYFSLGYPLDGNELILTTSKSSRYYVSGAYWARDCMLWAFPAILRANTAMARQALLAACTTYIREGPNHALYANGANLYPGFELDQLVAPAIALGRYVATTGEEHIKALPEIQAAARRILSQLEQWRDGATGLYGTELNPSDDPVELPLLIYNNALVLAALRTLHGWAANLTAEIATLAAALERHAVLQTGSGPLYAWAVDGKGNTEVYDDPPGSLLLMPYYGWPEKTAPAYQNTVRHYFSAQNPYYTQEGPVRGQGCEHAPAPWPMSLCNRLLVEGPLPELLDALAAIPMDNGIACETVRPEDGRVNTGAAFATFAGFYANAILEAFAHGD